ncbi:MAG TPA: 16S rRNA (cytosine(1402)-N(4))-methyltransferase RsmH [Candidatus Kryptonia bacterium]
MAGYHEPVLLYESIEFLVTNVSGKYVDATFGGGGHTARLLSKLKPDARVLAFDVDKNAIEAGATLRASDPRVSFFQSNFSQLSDILAQNNIKSIDGALFDLGVSSYQIDNESGFSYRRDEKLDMRLDKNLEISAFELVNAYDQENLSRVFTKYGEEPRGRAIARSIMKRREKADLVTTGQLVDAVSKVVGNSPALLSRIFQAIRIEVNHELESLSTALDSAVDLLSRGGRIVVISYHSLEDRMVKEKFKYESASCVCPPGAIVCTCGKLPRMKIVTRKPISPGGEEILRNRRSRSAKMRVAEKVI